MSKLSMLLIAVVFAPAVMAQADAEEAVKYEQTTEYSFEDDTIEGDLSQPDGEYVEARMSVKHSNLIQIREEFKDKVMQSVSEL